MTHVRSYPRSWRWQDLRLELHDWPKAVWGELDGPCRERTYRKCSGEYFYHLFFVFRKLTQHNTVRWSVVSHDPRVLQGVPPRAITKADALVLYEPSQVSSLPIPDQVPWGSGRQDHRVLGQCFCFRGKVAVLHPGKKQRVTGSLVFVGLREETREAIHSWRDWSSGTDAHLAAFPTQPRS